MGTDVLSKQANQVRILVVDDERRIRDACQQILLEQDFEVALAPADD
jgi:DNA-binding NtrC family response regulator